MAAAARRAAAHQAGAVAGIAFWVTGRRDGVGEGDRPAGYAGAQAALVFVLGFTAVVETVAMALLIPWPVAHRVLLVLDAYGVFYVVALHAACVVRPHVIGADGSLRLRYGLSYDLPVPAGRVAAARVELRSPEGGRFGRAVVAGGALDLPVAGQTSVTVELTEPVAGARVLRFHADDPRAAVAALSAVTA